jgi:hypothetical protein
MKLSPNLSPCHDPLEGAARAGRPCLANASGRAGSGHPAALRGWATALAAAVSLMAGTAHALPLTLDTTLTADNYYSIYFGGASGEGMRQAMVDGQPVRNELGRLGDPGRFNWSLPETWSLGYTAGEWLYIVAWSDDRVAQGWIGEFQTATEFFRTGLGQGWQFLLGDTNLGDDDPAPDAADVATKVAAGGWADVVNSRTHGVHPWGVIPGISLDANWIWGTPTMNEFGTGVGEYQIFRRALESGPKPDVPGGTVPEPGSLALALGALGLLALGRRRGHGPASSDPTSPTAGVPASPRHRLSA